MPSVADLVDEQALQHLAEQEAFQQGVECAERGCVQLVTFRPLQVTAEVTDTGLRRDVSELKVTSWHEKGTSGILISSRRIWRGVSKGGASYKCRGLQQPASAGERQQKYKDLKNAWMHAAK